MKIRQRVRRFDELTTLKARLENFISSMEKNNESILSFEGDDADITLAKEQLTKILDSKKSQLELFKKEYKEHDYFLKKTKTDLDRYRNTIEYIDEE